jgi:hypothetical protein
MEQFRKRIIVSSRLTVKPSESPLPKKSHPLARLLFLEGLLTWTLFAPIRENVKSLRAFAPHVCRLRKPDETL